MRRSFECAAASYDEAAVLAREVGSRLLERLDLIRMTPDIILDVGCGTGITTIELLKRYRKARVLGLDLALKMLSITYQRASWRRKPHCICGDAAALPLASASCDMIFSNLAILWCDLDSVLQEFQRVLKPGGVLLFSTLGPDTLKELRRSWAAADDYNHVNAFIDMHDIGDALMRTHLAEPVMDTELLTLTYNDATALMHDLKRTGAHNMTKGRAPGLTGRKCLRKMYDAYEKFRINNILPATFEVIYGHAWGAQQPLSKPCGNTVAVFPLTRLRR